MQKRETARIDLSMDVKSREQFSAEIIHAYELLGLQPGASKEAVFNAYYLMYIGEVATEQGRALKASTLKDIEPLIDSLGGFDVAVYEEAKARKSAEMSRAIKDMAAELPPSTEETFRDRYAGLLHYGVGYDWWTDASVIAQFPGLAPIFAEIGKEKSHHVRIAALLQEVYAFMSSSFNRAIDWRKIGEVNLTAMSALHDLDKIFPTSIDGRQTTVYTDLLGAVQMAKERLYMYIITGLEERMDVSFLPESELAVSG